MSGSSSIVRIGSLVPAFVMFVISLIVLNGAARPASAQCPEQWQNGPSASARAFVTMPNGDLYAGGGGGVFRWTGTSWAALSGISGVNALANFNGDLVAGGSGVSRWNGTAWTSIGSGIGTVYALTQFNNNLIAGGFFTIPGGRNIASWNGTSWEPMTNTLGQSVRALTVYNGSLIVGGHLDAGVIDGSGAQGVGIWDGTAWHTLGGGLGGVGSPVLAFTQYNGDLYAGGECSPRLARWNGTSWQATGYPWGYIWSLTVHQGDLFAGTGCNCPTADPYLWRLHNGVWQGITLGLSTNRSIQALASRGDDLFVGGTINGFYRTTCPRGDLNADGLVNDADQAILINVLLDIDLDPGHVARADVNHDGNRDGLDIAAFTACRTGGCP